LSDPALDPYYGAITYVSPKGTTYRGASIVYSVTIPETSRNREGAISLGGFLLTRLSQLDAKMRYFLGRIGRRGA
jgi:ABC-type molybdate transport system substrate-binding protein